MTPVRALATIVLLGACASIASCGSAVRKSRGGSATISRPGIPTISRRRGSRTGVGQASGGRVRVTVYSAAQLADWPEQSEGVHLGTLDLALAAVSHASQFCKELGLFGARYLFQNQVLWIPRMVMAGLSP